MPSLSSFGPSFYDTYRQRTRENEQAGMGDLQQIGTLMQLRNAVQQQQQAGQEQQRNEQMMAEISAIPPAQRNKATVLPIIMKYAKTPKDIAALLPDEAKAQAIGAGGLRLPTGEVVPPAARPEQPKPQSIGAGGLRLPDGTIVPPVMRPEALKEKTYPIVTTGDGIFERRPEGLIRLRDPKTGEPLRATARERPITEYQGKNAMYGVRASMADKTLLELEDKISVAGLSTKRALQDVPVVGGVMGAAGNLMLSKEQQQVEQAQRNFVNAVLRQESGAVINPSEFENAIKQYFPQPGDKKEVIERKRENRKAVIEGFKKIAGPAWNDQQQVSPPGGWSITPVK